MHDPAAWEGSVHVSAPEREALARIAALGLSDLFRRFDQPEKSWSWWDYRMNAFRRDLGLRIDLMLASKALAEALHGLHDRPRSAHLGTALRPCPGNRQI